MAAGGVASVELLDDRLKDARVCERVAKLAVPTEGSEGERTAEKLRAGAASLLPVPCEVMYASLLEEHEPERWTERERFSLAG